MIYIFILSNILFHQTDGVSKDQANILLPHEKTATHTFMVASDGEVGHVKNHFRKGSQLGIERESEPISALQTELEVTTTDKTAAVSKTVWIAIGSCVIGVILVAVI